MRALFSVRPALLILTGALVAIGMALAAIQSPLAGHPLLLRAERQLLPAFAPTQTELDDGLWSVRAYYYSLGAWPARFGGAPVLHSVPYQKGPPQQFLGRFVALWEAPEVRLAIEGPKTPTRGQDAGEAAGAAIDPALMQLCLGSLRIAEASLMECLRIRRAALGRHIEEMRQVGSADWQLRWFEVESALPGAERARGFHLRAQGPRKIEERYVLVNSKGVHQAVILQREIGERGDQASELLEKSIRSQRLFATLDPGRAWTDRELSGIRLKELSEIQGHREFGVRIADIQSLLVSKISVEPRSLDAFFHLGGTSLLLMQRASQSGILEWIALGRQNLQAAARYAEDVGIQQGHTDPRLKRIREMVTAASKL